MKLAGSQPGLLWVNSDVSPQVLILVGITNEMVEGLLLPKLPVLMDRLIDPKRCVMKPRIALLFHGVRSRESGEQMDMIRHHDEITQTITLAIEMQERVGHNLASSGCLSTQRP